jgi:hypothetical protein
VETNDTRTFAQLVGVPDVNVLAVDDEDRAVPMRVHVESRAVLVRCGGCGTWARLKDRRDVALVDLAEIGHPAVPDVAQAPLVVPGSRLCGQDVH